MRAKSTPKKGKKSSKKKKVEVQTGHTVDLTSSGLICVFTCGVWGGRKKLKKDQFQTAAKQNKYVDGLKHLVDPETLQPMNSVAGFARRDIEAWSLSLGIKSFHFIPAGLIARLDEKLNGYKFKFDPMAEAWLKEYAQLCEAAEEALGTLFNKDDYPTEEEMRGKFYMTWSWRPFAGPNQIEEGMANVNGIGSEMIQAQVQQAKQELQQTIIDWRLTLAGKFKELIDHVVERLTGVQEGGKRKGKAKVFRDSVVTNVTEFLETLPHLEAAIGSADLAKQAEKVRKLMAGIDIEELKKSDKLKSQVVTALNPITLEIDNMMKDMPRRKIRRFEEEAA